MADQKIAIPAEVHTLVEFRQRDLPGFATVNAALAKFAPRAAFPWHLSVLVCCDDLVDHRLPSADEQTVLYEFEDQLAPLIAANANALFLARVTHDARREIIWRVQDPEAPNSCLREILANKSYPREFDFRIESDPEWLKAEWYLASCGPD
jgi:hypothetical protein